MSKGTTGRGAKRTVDSGRTDTMGRTIKISGDQQKAVKDKVDALRKLVNDNPTGFDPDKVGEGGPVREITDLRGETVGNNSTIDGYGWVDESAELDNFTFATADAVEQYRRRGKEISEEDTGITIDGASTAEYSTVNAAKSALKGSEIVNSVITSPWEVNFTDSTIGDSTLELPNEITRVNNSEIHGSSITRGAFLDSISPTRIDNSKILDSTVNVGTDGSISRFQGDVDTSTITVNKGGALSIGEGDMLDPRGRVTTEIHESTLQAKNISVHGGESTISNSTVRVGAEDGSPGPGTETIYTSFGTAILESTVEAERGVNLLAENTTIEESTLVNIGSLATRSSRGSEPPVIVNSSLENMGNVRVSNGGMMQGVQVQGDTPDAAPDFDVSGPVQVSRSWDNSTSQDPVRLPKGTGVCLHSPNSSSPGHMYVNLPEAPVVGVIEHSPGEGLPKMKVPMVLVERDGQKFVTGKNAQGVPYLTPVSDDDAEVLRGASVPLSDPAWWDM